MSDPATGTHLINHPFQAFECDYLQSAFLSWSGANVCKHIKLFKRCCCMERPLIWLVLSLCTVNDNELTMLLLNKTLFSTSSLNLAMTYCVICCRMAGELNTMVLVTSSLVLFYFSFVLVELIGYGTSNRC